jgi:glyoxylase-like metal-dependent hydrolase (beta-lactamase superfamily II)
MTASTSLSCEEFVRAVETGEPFQVLDIRAPERLASGKVDIVPAARFVNYVGSQLLALDDLEATGLDPALPVCVVCARGMTSLGAASFLRGHGFTAVSLQGGINSWMLATVARELAPPPGCDRLLQFDRIGKGALGYLLVSAGEALLIDPSRNARPLLDAAAAAGARIVAIADTHVHADYLSGAPGLSQHLGVPYYLHPSDAVYPYDETPGRLAFSPLSEGQSLRVGNAAVEVQHTPGHTEGSVTFRVGDDAAWTGDFVFLRSLGRPDLAGKAAQWTAALWESLERARREWSRETTIYPAHYSAHAERREDHAVAGCFGDLLVSNKPLGIADRQEFFAWVSANLGSVPEAYRLIKAVNLGLSVVDHAQAEELEAGKNQCAVG